MKKLTVPPDIEPCRLDLWLGGHDSSLSRSRWQDLIQQGHVLVDGEIRKSRHLLHGGEEIHYNIPPATDVQLEPEAIALDILHEDADIIVANKATGMVVHPAPGHDTGTFVHALLHHCSDLRGIHGEVRPGIVHRLDKDTSGVLVAAKHEQALLALQKQFKARKVTKQYVAIVWGTPQPPTGTIDAPIGRSDHHRVRMAVHSRRGRDAVTHYTVTEAFSDVTLIKLHIETGRTHQIRVHMAHIHHPVVGDKLYGGDRKHEWIKADRQLLHAQSLSLHHPTTNESMTFTAPLAKDMQDVLNVLRAEGSLECGS